MKTPSTFDSESAANSVNTVLAQPCDEDLMSAIQLGDGHALETLMERYRGLLKNVILRVVHDHASADDVLQDCLVDRPAIQSQTSQPDQCLPKGGFG